MPPQQALASLASAEEILYNGIVMPDSSPLSAQEKGRMTGEPMLVPYLENPPAIIPIDVDRQLLLTTCSSSRLC